MTKEMFIQSLKNGKIPAQQNRQELEQLVKSDYPFDKFTPEITTLNEKSHHWGAEYFSQKVNELSAVFSKELVLHLIKVKDHLQRQGTDIRFLLDKTDISNANDNVITTKDIPELSITTQEIQEQHSSRTGNSEPLQPPEKLKDFKVSESLRQMIMQKDIKQIRHLLISLLNNNRVTLEDILLSFWHTYNVLPSVFEKHKTDAFAVELFPSEDQWSIDYFFQQQSALNYNFSLERALHLVNVRELLVKKGAPGFKQKAPETMSQGVNTVINNQSAANNPIKKEPLAKTKQDLLTQSKSVCESNPYQQSKLREDNEASSNNQFIRTVAFIGGAVLLGLIFLISIF